jgi:hypothetical protein
MSLQSTLDSFDTELFITEVEQLPAIADSRSYRNKKQKKTYAWETWCKKCIENSFFLLQILLCNNASVRTSPLLPIRQQTVGGEGGSCSKQLLSAIAALLTAELLKTARGKGA